MTAAAPAPAARAPMPAAAPTTATGTFITTGESAEPAHAASLQEVALRMERIKASAAAIRQAIEHEAEHAAAAPASTPMHAAAPIDEDDFSELADPPTVSDAPRMPAARTAAAMDDFDAPAPAAAPVSALERDFLGDDDDFGEASTEDFGDGAFDAGAFAPAPRPIPWRPILIAAGVLVAIGAYAFRAQLFPSPTEVAPADAVAKEDVRPGSVAPETAKAKPDPAAGKAVQPEPVTAQPNPTTPAPTAGAGTPPTATGGATAGTVAPTPGTTASVAGTPPTAARPTPDADTSARLDEARALYQSAKGGSSRKKLGEAKTLLQEILATAPKQADALLLLAQIELELGKADAALATATQCTEVAPDLADCWLTIGVLQQDRNKKADAATAYEKYLALAPDGRYAGDVRSQLKRLKK